MSVATVTTHVGQETFLSKRQMDGPATISANQTVVARSTLGGSGKESAGVATFMVRRGSDRTANAARGPTLEVTGTVSIALTLQLNARPSVVGSKGKLFTAKFSAHAMASQ